ncbi:MAG: hypothetical protein HY652_10500 [Acidobacteria bacterium]|nr:hypothetical protein [Acidobacteriota bacterium]
MTSQRKVWDPRGRGPTARVRLAPRKGDLDGKVVGILDINKAKGDLFLERVAELLLERFPGLSIASYTKDTFSRPAPEELLKEVVRNCNAVIEGLAD